MLRATDIYVWLNQLNELEALLYRQLLCATLYNSTKYCTDLAAVRFYMGQSSVSVFCAFVTLCCVSFAYFVQSTQSPKQ